MLSVMEPVEPLILADDLCVYSRDVLENPLAGEEKSPEEDLPLKEGGADAPSNKMTELY